MIPQAMIPARYRAATRPPSGAGSGATLPLDLPLPVHVALVGVPVDRLQGVLDSPLTVDHLLDRGQVPAPGGVEAGLGELGPADAVDVGLLQRVLGQLDQPGGLEPAGDAHDLGDGGRPGVVGTEILHQLPGPLALLRPADHPGSPAPDGDRPRLPRRLARHQPRPDLDRAVVPRHDAQLARGEGVEEKKLPPGGVSVVSIWATRAAPRRRAQPVYHSTARWFREWSRVSTSLASSLKLPPKAKTQAWKVFPAP